MFSLITALALNKKVVGQGFFRAAVFYPVLLSPVVVALIWKWILQRNGVLNGIILSRWRNALRLAPRRPFGVRLDRVRQHLGAHGVLYSHSARRAPGDSRTTYTRRRRWTRHRRGARFRRITLPLLMPSLLVVLVLSLIRAVQIFDEVFVLTGGGPGTATTYLVQFIYETGFAQQVREYGMASAASLLLAAVLMLLTLAQLRHCAAGPRARRRAGCLVARLGRGMARIGPTGPATPIWYSARC